MLKKMIPPPVLKATLEEMSMDWRDEEIFDANFFEEISNIEVAKKSDTNDNEAYSGSLVFKAGKASTSSLYYIDHTKIKGLSSKEKRKYDEIVASTKKEHNYLIYRLNQIRAKISQLAVEPMNDKLEKRLNELENTVVVLTKKIGHAKLLTVNESQKNRLKRQIQSMAGHYRKRKQLCCSFLSTLEEISDGSVSKKKCLLGEGQIALDSDESASRAAIAYSKSKKRLKPNKVSLADNNFVGVILDSQNMIKRIYLEEE